MCFSLRKTPYFLLVRWHTACRVVVDIFVISPVLCVSDPEHCGHIECMFECACRDESWKHPTSGSGITMNAVSIFNLNREQTEGLAVREKVRFLMFIIIFQEYEEPVYSYSTYPDRRFSSRYPNILKMSPPFASSEGVSASGDRYQSDGV